MLEELYGKKYAYIHITNFNKEFRPRINTDASTSEKKSV